MGGRAMKKTAAIFLALLAMAGLAQAMTVSAKVGPLIKEAQTLAQARNYKAALKKLDEAEAVKAYPDDETVINQLRQFIYVKSSGAQPLADQPQP
jgi:hypothetical protein